MKKYATLEDVIKAQELRVFWAKKNGRYTARRPVEGESGDWILQECDSNGVATQTERFSVSNDDFRKDYRPAELPITYKKVTGYFKAVSIPKDMKINGISYKANDVVGINTGEIISGFDFAMKYVDWGTIWT